MPNLPRFTLSFNVNKERWVLKNKTGQVVKSFDTKDDATKRGVLKRAVGNNGGSVRIEKVRGGFQEERTFPPSADPHRSPG